MTAVLLETYVDWRCPNCGRMDRTKSVPLNATHFHDCPALHWLTAPMVRAGTDCKVTAVERGDWLRDEEQRTGDDGKPYMAVVTEYADGRNDAAVFAPVATFGVRRNKQ